jgi:hypothetical protein
LENPNCGNPNNQPLVWGEKEGILIHFQIPAESKSTWQDTRPQGQSESSKQKYPVFKKEFK